MNFFKNGHLDNANKLYKSNSLIDIHANNEVLWIYQLEVMYDSKKYLKNTLQTTSYNLNI